MTKTLQEGVVCVNRISMFHLIESELTLSHAEGDIEDWREECETARALIKEAGFDIDVLYPILDRPSSQGPQ